MKIFECLAQHTLEKATHVTQWASLMDTSVGVTAKKPFFISWQISQFGHLFGLWDAYFNSVVSVAVLKAICRKNDNVEPKCKKKLCDRVHGNSLPELKSWILCENLC